MNLRHPVRIGIAALAVSAALAAAGVLPAMAASCLLYTSRCV